MNAPNAVPISSTSGMAAIGFQPRCSTSAASTMVVSATTEPTERSIPPDRITNVMPTATMMRKALSISRLRNTWAEKNPVYSAEPSVAMAMNSEMVAASGRYLGLNRARSAVACGAGWFTVPKPAVLGTALIAKLPRQDGVPARPLAPGTRATAAASR